MTQECARAETLAGAVALGEASDVEREQYRRHVAGCRRCITLYGGEREIERVAGVVAQARDDETWQPDLRDWMTARQKRRTMNWRYGLSGLAAAVVLSVGIHAIVAANVSMPSLAPAEPTTVAYGGMQITLERRPAHQKAMEAAAPAPAHQLVVVHNVVTLHRPAAPVVAAVPAPAPVLATNAKPAPHDALKAQPPATIVAMAPTQRDETSIAALRTAGTAPPPAARAESIAVVPQYTVIRDVMPIGGESAIVPHPAPIAYDEGAEGTTAFEVSVDERGAPTKCTITKPSGYLVLDEAVCKAAMHAHYSPKTINGHSVASVYRDAFTFRASDQQ